MIIGMKTEIIKKINKRIANEKTAAQQTRANRLFMLIDLLPVD